MFEPSWSEVQGSGFAALDSFRVQGLLAPGFVDWEFPEIDVCLPVLRKVGWRKKIEN